MFTKRIIAVVLALSLLVVSASAAGVYDIEEDISVFMMPASSVMSLNSDSGIALTATGSDYSEDIYLWLQTSLVNNLGVLSDYLSLIANDTVSLPSMVDLLKEIETRVGVYYLYFNGSTSSVSTTTSSTTLSDLVRYGFLGLADKMDDLITSVNGSVAPDYSSVLNTISSDVSSGLLDNDTIISHLYDIYLQAVSIDTELESLVDTVATESTLSALSGKVATQTTLSLVASRLTILPGQSFLSSAGVPATAAGNDGLTTVARSGFLGLHENILDLDSSVDTVNSSVLNKFSELFTFFTIGSGTPYLSSSGTSVTGTSSMAYSQMVRAGFSGLRSLIAGSESDNVYSGSITGNDNSETSFSSTGLGPMLNQYLDAVQHDTGLLAYMFASPEDLEAKKESLSTTEAITDGFLKSDSKASVSLDSVGSLKDASSCIQDLGNTGVDPGLAFEQLSGNGDLFAFFSAETANDLNTTVSTYSRDPGPQIVTNYYDQSRSEFFDLIGKEGAE